MQKLKLLLFGIKPAGKGIKTLGVSRTVVPSEFAKACQHWDKHMFDNINYI